MEMAKVLLLSIVSTCMALAQQAALSAGISPIPTVTSGTVIPDDSQQYVFLGPNISELTISYPSGLASGATSGGRITFTVNMLNRVKPAASTTVKRNSNGTYNYSFNLQNGADAPNGIKVWSIAMPAIDAVSEASQASWVSAQEPVAGNPNPPRGTVSMTPVSLTTWREPSGNSIAPGATASGFSINSPYLPGFTMLYARSGEDYAVPSDLPDQVTAQLNIMRQRDWMNRRVIAIGPRFPKAWTKDVIAADFKDGVAHLIATGDLDPSSKFVTALNSALNTLVGAAGATIPLDSVISMAATPMEKNIANAISISLQ